MDLHLIEYCFHNLSWEEKISYLEHISSSEIFAKLLNESINLPSNPSPIKILQGFSNTLTTFELSDLFTFFKDMLIFDYEISTQHTIDNKTQKYFSEFVFTHLFLLCFPKTNLSISSVVKKSYPNINIKDKRTLFTHLCEISRVSFNPRHERFGIEYIEDFFSKIVLTDPDDNINNQNLSEPQPSSLTTLFSEILEICQYLSIKDCVCSFCKNLNTIEKPQTNLNSTPFSIDLIKYIVKYGNCLQALDVKITNQTYIRQFFKKGLFKNVYSDVCPTMEFNIVIIFWLFLSLWNKVFCNIPFGDNMTFVVSPKKYAITGHIFLTLFYWTTIFKYPIEIFTFENTKNPVFLKLNPCNFSPYQKIQILEFNPSKPESVSCNIRYETNKSFNKKLYICYLEKDRYIYFFKPPEIDKNTTNNSTIITSTTNKSNLITFPAKVISSSQFTHTQIYFSLIPLKKKVQYKWFNPKDRIDIETSRYLLNYVNALHPLNVWICSNQGSVCLLGSFDYLEKTLTKIKQIPLKLFTFNLTFPLMESLSLLISHSDNDKHVIKIAKWPQSYNWINKIFSYHLESLFPNEESVTFVCFGRETCQGKEKISIGGDDEFKKTKKKDIFVEVIPRDILLGIWNLNSTDGFTINISQLLNIDKLFIFAANGIIEKTKIISLQTLLAMC